jgi:putative ABC transport system permease protein
MTDLLEAFARRVRVGLTTFAMALRGMSANRTRAFLSTLGIAIGVATLMAIYALVIGLQAKFAAQLGMLGADTLYVTSRPWIMLDDWWKYRNRPPLTMDDVDALERHGEFAAVAPMTFALGDVRLAGEQVREVMVRGTTAGYLDTADIRIDLGRFLSPIESGAGAVVAVLGSEVRERLFRGTDPIGSRVLVAGRRYTVIGVLAPQGTAFGQPLDKQVVLPIGAFHRQFGERRGLAIAVATPPDRIHAAEDRIEEILRRDRGLLPEQDNNFSINRQAEIVRIFQRETVAFFGVALAVGLITLIVGGVGVMNIMLVAVTERTREIGVRRAMGARRRTILAQFLIEASLVSLVGGALGTAAGLVGAWLLGQITEIAAAPPPHVAITGLLFSSAVGLVFGTWPAWRAARLDPIEALRYE